MKPHEVSNYCYGVHSEIVRQNIYKHLWFVPRAYRQPLTYWLWRRINMDKPVKIGNR